MSPTASDGNMENRVKRELAKSSRIPHPFSNRSGNQPICNTVAYPRVGMQNRFHTLAEKASMGSGFKQLRRVDFTALCRHTLCGSYRSSCGRPESQPGYGPTGQVQDIANQRRLPYRLSEISDLYSKRGPPTTSRNASPDLAYFIVEREWNGIRAQRRAADRDRLQHL
jgi:hypothetical protein